MLDTFLIPSIHVILETEY